MKWIWNSNNALNFPRTPPTFLCAFFSQLSAIEMIFFWFGWIVRKINKWKIENCIPKKNKWNKEKVFSHFFFITTYRGSKEFQNSLFYYIFFANRYLFHSYQFSFIWFSFFHTHESQSWGIWYFWLTAQQTRTKNRKKNKYSMIHKTCFSFFLLFSCQKSINFFWAAVKRWGVSH